VAQVAWLSPQIPQIRLVMMWASRVSLVEVPALSPVDMIEDAFGPLARDAAPIIEVGIRLQKALATVAALGDPDLARAAAVQSERALAEAEAALTLASDRERLAALAREVGPR
jgi:uncharacterized membrane protein